MGQPRRPTTPPARYSQDGPLPLRGGGRPQGSPTLAPPSASNLTYDIYAEANTPNIGVPHPSPLPALPLASASPPAAAAGQRGGTTTHGVVLPMFSPAAQQPTKRYRTIVADPPWHYSDPAFGYGADANYPTMTPEELMGMPVGLWAMDKAHLYLWTTNTFLVEAHEIAKAWGFKPKTLLTWIKRRPTNDNSLGMGHYFRVCTEHVLFAVRGSLATLHGDQPNFFFAPRTGHSEKPAAFYDMVQRMSLGPYLDVFARKQRFGWDTWGDEAFDFRTDGIWHGGSDA